MFAFEPACHKPALEVLSIAGALVRQVAGHCEGLAQTLTTVVAQALPVRSRFVAAAAGPCCPDMAGHFDTVEPGPRRTKQARC